MRFRSETETSIQFAITICIPPCLERLHCGCGVLVKVLRVGIDGTDKEINEAKYGMASQGSNFLIAGHGNFGQVVGVCPHVPDTIRPGTYVVASVRRPGQSVYDQIGLQDMTTDDVYFERGINPLHGYLTEYYVEDAAYIVPLPVPALSHADLEISGTALLSSRETLAPAPTGAASQWYAASVHNRLDSWGTPSRVR